MTRPRAGSALLVLTAICAVFAVFVALTGGIDVRIAGVPVRSRSWERPAALAAILGVVCLIRYRQPIWRLARRMWPMGRFLAVRLWEAAPVFAAVWAFGAGIFFGAFAVGGADSSGYVSQAKSLAHGRLTDPLPISPAFTWPDVPWTLTPLGYVPNRRSRVLAPSYPPGYPLMMAPLGWVDPRAVFLLVPLCAAVAVLCCWRIGVELGEPHAGRLGAVLLSVSPTFLYQVVQPMSDVPAAACWTAAVVLARSPRPWAAGTAGLLAGLACLVRPNLAPLTLLVAGAAATVQHSRARRLLICAASVIPALVVLALIQSVRYGSPLSSGYESIDRMFSLSNIPPNLDRYPRWLSETHTPLVWLWVLTPVWLLRTPPPIRAFAWIAYAFPVAVVCAYLPYSYFRPDEWFYTRFLLPGIPFMLLLGIVTLLRAARWAAPRHANVVTGIACVALGCWLVLKADRVGAFDVYSGEQKYPRVGAYVRERLPPSAFILSMQHSGSIRYYSGRPILRWDVLDRAWLDRAVSSLRSAGHEPFVVVDVDEDVAFRERFASTAQASLDRLVVIERIGHTTVYGFQ